jgi:hypothetical protein
MPRGHGFQSRYNAITSQRFYLATKVVDELCCRLASLKAYCEGKQREWLSSRLWLICSSLSNVGLDLAHSSFDKKVRLISTKSRCVIFRSALIDLSTWANDVFSVRSSFLCFCLSPVTAALSFLLGSATFVGQRLYYCTFSLNLVCGFSLPVPCDVLIYWRYIQYILP